MQFTGNGFAFQDWDIPSGDFERRGYLHFIRDSGASFR